MIGRGALISRQRNWCAALVVVDTAVWYILSWGVLRWYHAGTAGVISSCTSLVGTPGHIKDGFQMPWSFFSHNKSRTDNQEPIIFRYDSIGLGNENN